MALAQMSSAEAKYHIGEKREIRGYLYKTEIRPFKSAIDSAYALLYLGDVQKPSPDFVIIIKLNTKRDTRMIKLINNNPEKFRKKVGPEGADGKIFIFEGKPAK